MHVLAKVKSVFYCTNCGNETPKWMGRCPGCGAFNTMEEHVEKPTVPRRAKTASVGYSRKPQSLCEVASGDEIRFFTGMGELDRVLGGGAVAGSLVLVGGAPGIGKSTLLLQICDQLCKERRVLYVSGEESERQLKLRAQRLGVAPKELLILSETRLSDILEAVEDTKPDILIVDSIQTLYQEENESAPGSVSQVKGTSTKTGILPALRFWNTWWIVFYILKETPILLTVFFALRKTGLVLRMKLVFSKWQIPA